MNKENENSEQGYKSNDEEDVDIRSLLTKATKILTGHSKSIKVDEQKIYNIIYKLYEIATEQKGQIKAMENIIKGDLQIIKENFEINNIRKENVLSKNSTVMTYANITAKKPIINERGYKLIVKSKENNTSDRTKKFIKKN